MSLRRDIATGAAVAAIGAGALLLEYNHHRYHMAESHDEANEVDIRRPQARRLHSAHDTSRSRYRDEYRNVLSGEYALLECF
jgi:hypothetical protein